MLALGSRGPAVNLLQQQLGITQDGMFGAQTQDAVKAFQEKNGLKADGIVGPQTQALLDKTTFNLELITVCPGLDLVQGFDISYADPVVNFDEAKLGGMDFCIIKSTEGLTIVDDCFKSHWQSAKEAGLIRGAYHFLHPKDDPIAQAKFVTNVVGDLDSTDLPISMDWETTDSTSPSDDCACALSFLDEVKRITGKTPICYSYPSFFLAAKITQDFAKYPLWISHPYAKCPSTPNVWTNWTFWQYSWRGTISGIPTKLNAADMNYFNGTLDDLKKLASGS